MIDGSDVSSRRPSSTSWLRVMPAISISLRPISQRIKDGMHSVGQILRPNGVEATASYPRYLDLLSDDTLFEILCYIRDVQMGDRAFLSLARVYTHRRALPVLAQICKVSRRLRRIAIPFLYHCIARPAPDIALWYSSNSALGWEGRLITSLKLPGAEERFQHTRAVDCEDISAPFAHHLAVMPHVRAIRTPGLSPICSEMCTAIKPRGLFIAGGGRSAARSTLHTTLDLDWAVFSQYVMDEPEWGTTTCGQHKIRSLAFESADPRLALRLLPRLSVDHLVELELCSHHQQDLELFWTASPVLSSLKTLTLCLGPEVQDLSCVSDKIPACLLRLDRSLCPYDAHDKLHRTLPRHITGLRPDPKAIMRRDDFLKKVVRDHLPDLLELQVCQHPYGCRGGRKNFAARYESAIRWLEETSGQRQRPVPVRAV